ncbi:MAG: dethiobiotin synthase [Corynebacteriales bacterium]|uniref:ATP-dependent dethiobiotin synthetase BioD n=1 Tax=Williamsia herbipolensis TaxID=1603258 RepID=A0AAU4K4J8_9NOCA|nr:dethiobiotin synthase [Williamsia herbipolensis]MCX6470094.1 dethiobiotin synthase [Mycobacteriales bacterium]
MTVVVVTGTSTDVGKTVATAALAATAVDAGLTVAVCKPVQTGMGADEPGDLAEVGRLAGVTSLVECARYPEPLAPETAATRAGMPMVALDDITAAVADAAARHDLVLVEGAGGVLVRLATDLTMLDVATALDAPVVVVADGGLGTLNHTELTVDALRGRGLTTAGIVIGSWPAEPDLATRCNRDDLPRLTGVTVAGAVPAGAGAMTRPEFCSQAPSWFDTEWVTGLVSG